ncbi:MAG: AtpZ/AtpI family protein [Planctomycetes bacterium]|nr:AtpZ/AtpI family protein [Planctomycetota bacterium]
MALEMAVPGIIGTWLDRRWHTHFLTLVGLAIGVSVGIWHLLILTGSGNGKGPKRPNSEKPTNEHHEDGVGS